jgi:hypothetical protein
VKERREVKCKEGAAAGKISWNWKFLPKVLILQI